ncbi:hypothetical protein B0H19DRAFT_154375 [Mycena capillaripes]|nr:hypothetical protein B0H19DRAFT_154375 [Mycena capillaripes]
MDMRTSVCFFCLDSPSPPQSWMLSFSFVFLLRFVFLSLSHATRFSLVSPALLSLPWRRFLHLFLRIVSASPLLLCAIPQTLSSAPASVATPYPLSLPHVSDLPSSSTLTPVLSCVLCAGESPSVSVPPLHTFAHSFALPPSPYTLALARRGFLFFPVFVPPIANTFTSHRPQGGGPCPPILPGLSPRSYPYSLLLSSLASLLVHPHFPLLPFSRSPALPFPCCTLAIAHCCLLCFSVLVPPTILIAITLLHIADGSCPPVLPCPPHASVFPPSLLPSADSFPFLLPFLLLPSSPRPQHANTPFLPGGQRRALRRTELDTLDEYPAVKAEVDADPETAFDEVLADVRPKRPSSSSPLKQSPASAPAAKPKDAFAASAEVTSASAAASKTAETALGDAAAALAPADGGEAAEVEDERTIAARRAELAGPAYDEVRAMEEAAGRVAWARGLEKGTGSLDAERETSGVDALEAGELGVEVEALGQGQVKGGDSVNLGRDEFLRAVEALGPSSASSPASASDAPTPTRPQTRTPLDLGDDPEIARLVSAGVRAALTHPDSVGELLRAPVGVDAPGGGGGAGGWTETGVLANRSSPSPSSPSYDDNAESDSDRQGEAVGEVEGEESDDEDGRDGLGYELEEETGADELFLGKYAESSGNARAFVGGLVGTLQTSG